VGRQHGGEDTEEGERAHAKLALGEGVDRQHRCEPEQEPDVQDPDEKIPEIGRGEGAQVLRLRERCGERRQPGVMIEQDDGEGHGDEILR
jgi:hypothetical protein